MEITIQIYKSKSLNEREKQAALKLWNSEYPSELAHASYFLFENYLNKLGDVVHYLVLDNNENNIAWAFVFDRDEERWFGIILDSTIHGQGIGKKLMQLLQQDELELNGWVIDHNKSLKSNGSLYISPLPFYQKLQFQVLPDIRLELPQISAVKIHWKKDSSSNH